MKADNEQHRVDELLLQVDKLTKHNDDLELELVNARYALNQYIIDNKDLRSLLDEITSNE